MSLQDTNYTYNFSGKNLSFDRPRVMGILNVSPDSFFDGGRYSDEEGMLSRTEKMLLEGADIIDIGAYSTRPGATDISEAEELNRLIPALKALRKNYPDTLISIDSFRSFVAKCAVEEGADIVNDISGGTIDALMFDRVTDLKAGYILTHIKGHPSTMQEKPSYKNVVEEVGNFFTAQLAKLKPQENVQVFLDPGFGFGKTIEHNFQLLKSLAHFKHFGLPLLVGLSRKSMISKSLGITADEALNGTTALHSLALLNGADILRVHDVKEAMECIQLIQLYGR